MKSEQPAAEFRSVSFAYDRSPVLKNISLAIEPRDFVSVIGPNGAGKSTLARLLIGLLEPTEGEVQLFGGKPKANRDRVGYVPQYSQFDRKFPVLVQDVVMMGRLSSVPRLSRKRDREVARHVMHRVGLSGLERRSFNALSGGQRQRVLIARALVAAPRFLIMDEPTSNVDKAAEESLIELLTELNEEMTIMLITHDLGFVSGMVNKVLCVNVEAMLHRTQEVTEDMIRNLFGQKARFVEHHTHG